MMTKVKTSKLIALCICAALVVSVLTGCGAKYSEEQLIGEWYVEDFPLPFFTFRDDGTCVTLKGSDGTWSITDGDQLHLVEVYGKSGVLTIDSIKDGCLTLSDEDGPLLLWDSPHPKAS